MTLFKTTIVTVAAAIFAAAPAVFAIPAISSPVLAAASTSVRLRETPTQLFVSGGVRMSRPSPAAHVDVQLLSASGSIVGHAHDAVAPAHPRTARGHIGRLAYAVSFPRAEADRAAVVRVVASAGPHACP